MYISEWPIPSITIPQQTNIIPTNEFNFKTVNMVLRYMVSSETILSSAIAYDVLVGENTMPLVASYSDLDNLRMVFNGTVGDLRISIGAISDNIIEMRRELNRKDTELCVIKNEMRHIKQLLVLLAGSCDIVEKHSEIEFSYNELNRVKYQ